MLITSREKFLSAIQMVASRATPKLLSITCEKGKTAAARCAFGSTWTHPHQCLPQTSSAPLSRRRCSNAAERKERLQTILWNFGICDKDRVSRNTAWHYHKPDSWTSSSALFPPWFECQHPWWICLRSSVSVATNYLCFVSTILCFYHHFFLMCPLTTLLSQMQPVPWRVDSTCKVHGRWL